MRRIWQINVTKGFLEGDGPTKKELIIKILNFENSGGAWQLSEKSVKTQFFSNILVTEHF